MQVRILPGSPNSYVKSNDYWYSLGASCSSLHDYAVCFARNSGFVCTKPVQIAGWSLSSASCGEKKNPGSAATETGIKSTVKASSFPSHLTANLDVEATSNQGGKLLPGGAS
ncbi:hypothetical protein [Celeribacter baekdonensis]|uniref:hypothetical protein n=1 Tax=Celeribacter baekdonensis TaxID=875171 RepID=UPI0026EDDAFC|nr:hypothetical protein [Celeribacter baekdonensis]